jgi:HSP20 family protein
MTIVRWEPVRDLLGLRERMNRLFEESARGLGRGQEEDWVMGAWAPAVDIYEKGTDVVLKAELPGLDPKDVDIRIENNVLTLKGERKIEDEIKQEDYHRVERSYGGFTRSFTLPSTVDTTNVKADYKDGVLRITLPKREEAKPKQIQVDITSVLVPHI